MKSMKFLIPTILLGIFTFVLSNAIHKPEEAFVREGTNVIGSYLDSASDFNQQAMNGQDPFLRVDKIDAAKKHAREEVKKAGDEGFNDISNFLFILVLLALGVVGYLVYTNRRR